MGVVVVERRDPLCINLFINVHLCIHLLLNCVHKCTAIYDGIVFLAIKGVVVVDWRSTLYPSPSELCSQKHRYL